MFWQGLRKAPNKVNERIVKSKGSFAVRIGNRIHRRVVFATICLILVVILAIIINNSVFSTVVAKADSIREIKVEIYSSGRILNPDEVIPIDLILNVSPAVSGIIDFSFDMVINAAG
jgi:hypothetical protein